MSFTYPTPTTIDTFYTDANGTLVTPEKLPYGKGYFLVEVEAPYGYVLDKTPVYFDVTADNSTTEESGVTVIKVNKANTAQKGTVTVEKNGEVFWGVDVNGDENSVIYQPIYKDTALAGAVFEIRAAEDIITPDGTTRYTKGELVDTVTTDKDGLAKTKELYLGKYEVKEITAPHGFVLSGETHTVELVYAGQNVAVTETATSFYNERQKATLSITKVLETNDLFGIGNNGEIKKVVFGLYAAEELVSSSGTSIPADGLIEVITFDENGLATIKTDLPIGSYYVKEIATDEHYILNSDKYEFTFEYQGQEIVAVALSVNGGKPIENELIYGSVSGKKVDENGNALGGAVIGLFKKNETEFTKDTALMTTVSADDGSFSFANIPYGEWVVREIEQPVGFVLSDTAFDVVIKENGQVVEVEIVNEYALNSTKIVGYGHPRFDVESDTNETVSVSGTPSTGSDTDAKIIWTFLMAHIDNEYGVAGLMGNLYAESALRSNNLQQSYETKLGYNDTTYTVAVDNGSYDNFVKDAAGYGLAQWTYWSRKQAMLEFHQSKKKSIGDLQTQLEFLIKELSESYKGVWSDLKNATSIQDASNSVLLKFECPANQGESVQKKRAEYGQKYYDKFADTASATTPDTSAASVDLKFKVGDIVQFIGTNHYASANASSGPKIKASKAKVTAISKNGKHPYHCRAVNDAGAFIGGVYGWVNASDLSSVAAAVPAPKPTTPTTPTHPAAIKKGDIVSIAKNATYYNGRDIPDWVVAKNWIVSETPVGDRVVINKSVDGKHAINSPVNAMFLTVVQADEHWVPKVGDFVQYNGNKHYVNANATKGSACKGGLAKITNIYQLGKSKHPYHLIRVAGKGGSVYGWVDEGSFTKA